MKAMLIEATVSNIGELRQVLALQQLNLKEHISEIEKAEQGFLTLQHDLNTLQAMHQLAPSILIKDGPEVVAYALTMVRECRQLVPDLEPMFALFDRLEWKRKPLNDFRFYVMGQICVAKAYRGQGLFNRLYMSHREIYRDRFDLLLTEISTRNIRSVRAHERIGFKTIHKYRDEIDEWLVVGWDWS